MQYFQFKSTSFLHFSIILAAGVCLTVFLITDLQIHTKRHAFLFVFVTLMIVFFYFVAHKHSRQIVTIGMNSSYLHLTYERLPAFIVKESKLVPWSHIQEYHHHPDKEQDAFEIILSNSEKLKFFISHSKEQNEAFYGFYVQFARYFHQLEKSQLIQLEQLISGLPQNFYQTKIGIALAYVIGISAILLLLYVLITPNLPFTWRTVCLLLGFAACYIQLVWLYNRKQTNSQHYGN